MQAPLSKSILRKQFMASRAAITLPQAHLFLAQMLRIFDEIPLPDGGYVLSYRAIAAKQEIPMDCFETQLMDEKKGFTCCYPAANFIAGTMQAFTEDEQLIWEDAPFGLVQPSAGNTVKPYEIAMVFVPLLAFDLQGYRLGYGKGFYDRFLATCKPDVLKIGFSWFQAIEEMPEINAHDLPLDYCITPERLYVF